MRDRLAAGGVVRAATPDPGARLREALDGVDRVVVIGDVHGDMTAFLTLVEQTAEMHLTPVLVSVGDLGIGPWGAQREDAFLRRADEALEKADAYLLLTPGNHENWDTIDEALADRRDPLGFGLLGRHGRVRVSPRGHRFTVGGRHFGSLGGAVSVDRAHRTSGHPWWPQEVITAEHVATLGSEALDVLIAHDVPAGVPMRPRMTGLPAQMLADAAASRDLVARAVADTRPAVVFAGHWHVRLTHQLTLPDGGWTRVEVLSEEHTPGNAVVLDLDDLEVAPLATLWRRHLADG